ncbi:MAG: hypothetical protein PHG85_06370 [Candidatus Altiarchaeota archaeon]|nr:hypothetical protein [Candidatus Altiarchaeota archaeon]
MRNVTSRQKAARQDEPEGSSSAACGKPVGNVVDVTTLLTGVLDENTFSLSAALKGSGWNKDVAVLWKIAMAETGWTDRGLCRTLVLFKTGLDKLKSVSASITGTSFAFDRVCLAFDDKEYMVFSDEVDGKSVLFLNLLRATPGNLRSGLDYILPRELARSVLRKGVGGSSSGVVPACVGVNPFIDFAPAANFHPAETVFNTEDVAMAFNEVLTVKLGLRLAESAGMAAGFRQGFRDYVNEELVRYKAQPDGVKALAEISVIAGIIASSSFLRESDIVVHLSAVAGGMISGAPGAGALTGERSDGDQQSKKKIEAGYAALSGSLHDSTRAEFRRK